MTANAQTPPAAPIDDPYLWLEDVQGERALAWVRERNAQARDRLQAWPDFMPVRQRIREVLDSRDRIPAVRRRGEVFYNLWQDAANPRGLWRRTTLAEYRKAQPDWETVLDVDALGQAEGVNWVMTRLMLGIVFYGMLAPTGLIMRMMGNDPLKQRRAAPDQSYWETPEPQPVTEEQFRQMF